MPSDIGRLTELLRLDLRRNRIATLPDEIANLKNLRYLTLYGNSAMNDEERYRIRAMLPDCEILF